jgi:hypothetical protein
MSADVNPIEYWTPVTPMPVHAPGKSMFTGPQSVGCLTMLAIVVLAAVLAFAIVTALAWVLG